VSFGVFHGLASQVAMGCATLAAAKLPSGSTMIVNRRTAGNYLPR
jgi:hypothetical protein